MDSQLRKGLLEICVLANLQSQESYGYKIVSDISVVLAISESTLYPILKRLEEAGSLSTRTAEHNGRLRKYYIITSQGKVRLHEYMGDIVDMQRVLNWVSSQYGGLL
jgi:PadR family transcriptional regulator PadR